MTQKTPYEIRLELLKMAKDLLVEDFYTKRHYLQLVFEKQLEDAVTAGKPLPANPFTELYPTEEGIIKRAKVLNEFVSRQP